MLNDSKDVFIFELNESLYFNKGQEITEMIGISLDPEISIQPFNDYVSIRGVIKLKGEYLKSTEDINGDDTFDFDDYHFRRYLENVEEINDSRAVFSHRFPVEISVPSYRVSNIEDITVSIESFDYELPNENELKLNSSIEIHGISEQISEMEEIKEKEEETFDESLFEFEVKEKPKDQADDLRNVKELPIIQPTEKTNSINKDTKLELEPESSKKKLDEIDEDPESWNPKETQTFTEFFEEKVIEEIIEDSPEKLPEEGSQPQVDYYEKSDSDEEADKEELMSEEEVSSNTECVEDEVVQPEASVNYLSDMFRGGDEQEPYAQMRVCIVQQTDTIESIAERYQISVLQLVNANRLDDDTLSEGQLLNIPQKQKIN